MRKSQGELKVFTWWRESTGEWVGEVNGKANDTSFGVRVTGKTEDEARNAAYCVAGHTLMETTWN